MRAVLYHPDAPANGVTAYFDADEADVALNLAAAAPGSVARVLDGTAFYDTKPQNLPTLAAFDAATSGD